MSHNDIATRAAVLGPGGVPGTAWLIGVVAGLRHAGVDLAAADRVVGTSAGAIVAGMLCGTTDFDQHANLQEIAGAAPDDPEEAWIAGKRRLLGDAVWRPGLLIPTVDLATRRPRVWTARDGAPLERVVAASSAMPGMAPPVAIDGRRHIDGAFRAGMNLDLAAGAHTVVIVDPLARLIPDTGRVDAARVVRIPADSEATAAFGPDLGDRATWPAAYQAGLRQATTAARHLRPLWT